MRTARPGPCRAGPHRVPVRNPARPEALGAGRPLARVGLAGGPRVCGAEGAGPTRLLFWLFPDPLCLYLGVSCPLSGCRCGVRVYCSHLVFQRWEGDVGVGSGRWGVGSDRLQPSGRGPHAGPDGFSLAPGGMGRVCLELGCSPGIGAGGAESFPADPRGTPGRVMEMPTPHFPPRRVGTPPWPRLGDQGNLFSCLFSYLVRFLAIFVVIGFSSDCGSRLPLTTDFKSVFYI